MKVIITNTAVLNTGDAAILHATIDILRRALGARLEVKVYDQQAEVAVHYYPEIDFRPVLADQLTAWAGKRPARRRVALLLLGAALWRSPLRAVIRPLLPPTLGASLDEFSAADLVVSAGGTYLVPHYRILPKVVDLLVAALMRRPFILFTQSLGPFPPRRRWLIGAILRQARVILVRDGRSRNHLAELGIRPDRIAECADAAFALAARGSAGPSGGAAQPGRPLRVAVSVRDWPHLAGDAAQGMERYIAAVAAMVARVIERTGGEVTFISTCQGVAEYWTDDSRVAEAVVAHLPADIRQRVRIDREFHRPGMLLADLGNFDVVVATRMHVAILALCAGVPVLPISYEFKTTELFARLGLGGLVQDMDSVTGESLCAALDRFLEVRPNLSAALPQWVGQLRHSAFSAAGWVRKAIEAPS